MSDPGVPPSLLGLPVGLRKRKSVVNEKAEMRPRAKENFIIGERESRVVV